MVSVYPKLLIESASSIVWGRSRLRVSGKTTAVIAPIKPQTPNTQNGKLTHTKTPLIYNFKMKLVKYYIEIKLNAFDLDYNIKDGYKSFVKFFKTLKI